MAVPGSPAPQVANPSRCRRPRSAIAVARRRSAAAQQTKSPDRQPQLRPRIHRGQIVAEQLTDAAHPAAQRVAVDPQLGRGRLHLAVVPQERRKRADEILVGVRQRVQYRGKQPQFTGGAAVEQCGQRSEIGVLGELSGSRFRGDPRLFQPYADVADRYRPARSPPGASGPPTRARILARLPSAGSTMTISRPAAVIRYGPASDSGRPNSSSAASSGPVPCRTSTTTCAPGRSRSTGAGCRRRSRGRRAVPASPPPAAAVRRPARARVSPARSRSTTPRARQAIARRPTAAPWCAPPGDRVAPERRGAAGSSAASHRRV